MVNHSRPLTIAVDLAVLAWLAAMLLLEGAVRSELERLTATADSMTEIAVQENQLASTLDPLRVLPVGGDQIANAERDLRQAAIHTRHDATVTRDSLHDLAGSAFLLIVLLAVFPILAFYIPMRLTRLVSGREVRGNRRAAA